MFFLPTHLLPVTKFSIVQIENNLLMFIQLQQIATHRKLSSIILLMVLVVIYLIYTQMIPTLYLVDLTDEGS